MTGEKYYIKARGNSIIGPMTMDDAREKASKMGLADNVKGVKILSHVDTVVSGEGKKNEEFRRFLPEQAEGNPPDHAGPKNGDKNRGRGK